LERAQQQL
jgi:predicted transcriptional regulator